MDPELTFVADVDGRPETCTVLFTFSSDVTGADYMLYTPDDPNGSQVRVMAARYDPQSPGALYPLQDDRDRAIVQTVLDYVSRQEDDAEEEADDGIRTVEDLPC